MALVTVQKGFLDVRKVLKSTDLAKSYRSFLTDRGLVLNNL